MKKIIVIIVALLMVALVSVPANAATQPDQVLPGGAKWVIHFDIQQFLATKLSKLVTEGPMAKYNKFKDKIGKELNMDPLNDLKGVTVFGLGANKEEPVVCISGKLPKDFILGKLKEEKDHKEIAYGKVKLHSWDNDHFGAFVGDNMAVVGENETGVKAALDAIAGKGKSKSPLLPLLKEIPREAFLKAAAHDIAALADDKEASAILKKTGMALFGVMEKNGNLKINLKLATESPETAKNIESIVKGFVALGEMRGKEKMPEQWKLIEHLKVNLKGKVVEMEFSYPSEQLLDLIGKNKHHEHKDH